MIPFDTWLSQILNYCRFVLDTVGLRRAWVEGDALRTSVTGFDELYEQIFDDLDSDGMERQLAMQMSNDPAARQALSGFLESLRSVGGLRLSRPELQSAAALMRSAEWQNVERAARTVLLEVTGDDGGEAS
jgi:hypothetical protein